MDELLKTIGEKTAAALPGAVLDQRAPEVDKFLGVRRRRQAGQALAHHQRQRFLDRRVGAGIPDDPMNPCQPQHGGASNIDGLS